MKKHIVDEQTGIPYTLVGDYYLPWGDLPNDEHEQRPIGVWGQRHRRFLKENHRVRYMNLLTSGKLNAYLADMNEQAEELFSRLVKDLAEKKKVNEQLKADHMMKWVRMMNNIRACAEELVMNDLICVSLRLPSGDGSPFFFGSNQNIIMKAV